MDLQENVREKEEVIQSRNRAFKLIAEELNQNRTQLAEKDSLIQQLQQSSAFEGNRADNENNNLISLKVKGKYEILSRLSYTKNILVFMVQISFILNALFRKS